ncbi:MAG: hypothetical protein FWF00_05345 [Endomicrobia bacterium]|nr:hypothetical protein [Endomicrobiia bacterium]MCL2507094.1 hypothetical protein [Endomicrobiia bacterium]
MKTKILSLLFLFAVVPVFASAPGPQWIKTEKHINYPNDTFITRVGKGSTFKEAESAAKRIIVNEIVNAIQKSGFTIRKADKLDAFILRSYASSLSYNNKAAGEFYVFGTVNRNTIRMDIEKEILSVRGNAIHNLRKLDDSVSNTVQKIREVDNVLAKYRHEDVMILLKQYLKGDNLILESPTFEKERLIDERIELFQKVSYVLKVDDFNTARVKKFFSENGLVLLPSVPDQSLGRDIIAINCKKDISESSYNEGFKYDWTAEVSFTDAYNPGVVIYSNSSSGSESSAIEHAAGEKARLSAEQELNDIIFDFLKTTFDEKE